MDMVMFHLSHRFFILTTSTATAGPVTTQSPSCVDKLDNCDRYDAATACKAPYEQWAMENCMKYCNMCGKYPQHVKLNLS